jgi:hypothetical protein
MRKTASSAIAAKKNNYLEDINLLLLTETTSGIERNLICRRHGAIP